VRLGRTLWRDAGYRRRAGQARTVDTAVCQRSVAQMAWEPDELAQTVECGLSTLLVRDSSDVVLFLLPARLLCSGAEVIRAHAPSAGRLVAAMAWGRGSRLFGSRLP
jgi:hypothetical protein